MHDQRAAVLLSDANRQVQIADHLLTVTYPMVKDPKLLLSVVEHGRRAIEDASKAVVEHHLQRGDYELPRHAGNDTLLAFADLLKVRNPDLPGAQDATRLMQDFQATLKQHKESPTTFVREEKLVIASDGFSFLKEVTPQELKRSLVTIKQFVHGANRYVVKS